MDGRQQRDVEHHDVVGAGLTRPRADHLRPDGRVGDGVQVGQGRSSAKTRAATSGRSMAPSASTISGAEPVDQGLIGRPAGGHHLTGDPVGVDQLGTVCHQQLGHGGLARPDAAGEPDCQHGRDWYRGVMDPVRHESTPGYPAGPADPCANPPRSLRRRCPPRPDAHLAGRRPAPIDGRLGGPGLDQPTSPRSSPSRARSPPTPSSTSTSTRVGSSRAPSPCGTPMSGPGPSPTRTSASSSRWAPTTGSSPSSTSRSGSGQRFWMGSLFFAAGTGVWYLGRLLGSPGPGGWPPRWPTCSPPSSSTTSPASRPSSCPGPPSAGCWPSPSWPSARVAGGTRPSSPWSSPSWAG